MRTHADAAEIPVPRPGAPLRSRRGRSAPDRSGAGFAQEGEAADGVCDEAAGARRLREAAARLHRQRRPDRRARPLLRPGRRLLGLPHAQGGDALPPASGQAAKGGAALALRFLGSNRNVAIRGERPGPGRVNYLLGNDPAKWRTGLRTYERVVYRNLWPGVDMVFAGQNGELKYEFLVRPGARVRDIRLAYRGAKRLSLDRRGNLRIHTSLGVLTDTRPASYQFVAGKRVPVASSFALEPHGGGYGFAVEPTYDRRYPLLIDPGLLYSTYLGGGDLDLGHGIAVDGAGSAYLTGLTSSADFPTTAGAFDTTFNGGLTPS